MTVSKARVTDILNKKVSSSLVQTNAVEIQKSNTRTAKTLSTAVFCLTFGLLIICLLVDDFNRFTLFYGVFCGVNMLCCGVAHSMLTKHPRWALLSSYLLMSIALLFGIALGIFVTPESPAVTFIVALVLVPMLVIDQPHHITLFITCFAALFLVMTNVIQNDSVAVSNTMNCAIYTVLGIVLNYRIAVLKLTETDSRRMLTLQRDTDVLTGLPNRRVLFERLEAYDMDDTANSQLCAMIMDIDDFKLYNDTYGHPEGDDCLRSIGKCFASFAEVNGLAIYRYGGEEFILLTEKHSYEQLPDIVQTLMSAVKALDIPFLRVGAKKVSLSIGYADVKKCGAENFDNLLTQADMALYYAKSCGKSCARGYLDIPADVLAEATAVLSVSNPRIPKRTPEV